ncbi:MAG: hypothetical protein ACK50U_08140 [Acidobacteriota bacterium]
MAIFTSLLFCLPLLSQSLTLKPFEQVYVKQDDIIASAGKETWKARDGATWTRRERGVLRQDRLFHSKRFLPCDEVLGFRESEKGHVIVQTRCGQSEFWFQKIRLADKARHYEEIAARHDRHGFIADTRGGQRVSNDNDGLWTAMYAAAKLFEYAATGSKEALTRAERATRAVLFLEQITGTPGYPARSYIDPSEEKPKDGFWYWTPDQKHEFKSDTSSDESVGHFLLFGLAWDLLPRGELRDQVRETCRRQMDYILQHGYHLIDPKTGKPTRWGKWSPAYFDGEGREDSPLNSVELMSFLRTTEHVTGDAKYGAEMKKVAEELGYLKIAGLLKQRRIELNYSDEELAMLSFYPLIRYEKNPQYREAILKAMDDWFENERREKNPLWNAIYELGRGENRQLRRASVETLERMPLDLRKWRVENSWRKELPLAPGADRFGRRETTVLLPADERAVMKWNSNPFTLDGGGDPISEDDGTTFLLPYWMGRYHKLWTE